ncbi:hypothetical protein NRS6096_22125 (plasmid) [Bacillus subtilis]|nr:hypothetical protein NRS6096_22125 [Bacillus subtilis]
MTKERGIIVSKGTISALFLFFSFFAPISLIMFFYFNAIPNSEEFKILAHFGLLWFFGNLVIVGIIHFIDNAHQIIKELRNIKKPNTDTI